MLVEYNYVVSIPVKSKSDAKRIAENEYGGMIWQNGTAWVSENAACTISYNNQSYPVLNQVIKSLPKLEQRQDSTNDQLKDLCVIASRLGMYDALTHLQSFLLVDET